MRGPHHHRSGTADDDNFAELDPLVAVGDAIACTGAAAAAAATAGGAGSPADAALALSRVQVLERNRGLLGRMLDLEEANITDKVQSPGAALAQPWRSPCAALCDLHRPASGFVDGWSLYIAGPTRF